MSKRSKKVVEVVEEVEEEQVKVTKPRKQRKPAEVEAAEVDVSEEASEPKRKPRATKAKAKQVSEEVEVEEEVVEKPKRKPRATKAKAKEVEEVEEVAEEPKRKPRAKKAKQVSEEEVVEEEEEPKKKTRAKRQKKETDDDTATDEDVVQVKKKKRCFRAVDRHTGREYGRYTGKDELCAGNKAFSQEKKRAKKEGREIPLKGKVYLRETTQGSNKGFYGVKVKAIKLDTPHTREVINQKTGEREEIVYHYRNKNESIEVPDDLPALYEAWNKQEREEKAATKPKTKSKKQEVEA